jgi:hypothetical protein
MFKKMIKFIHAARVYFLLFITVSFFYYLGLNPVDVGCFIGAKMGSAVGMSVSVPENPFNRLALQLKEKEERLNQKEIELSEREKILREANRGQERLVIGLTVGIVILFGLIVLNYYLDYRRRSKE